MPASSIKPMRGVVFPYDAVHVDFTLTKAA
jgi:hypothetical protein